MLKTFSMIKQYILSLPFVRDALNQSFDNGFSIGADVTERVDQLASKKVSDLLGYTDEDLVMTYAEKQGFIFLGGERVEADKCLNLKQEAELILSTDLWKIMVNTIGDQAKKVMFEKSQTYEDMRSGKMMLYNLSLQSKILEMFKNYQKK